MATQSPRPQHQSLTSEGILPLFDTLFGVALTLLAYSLPDHLKGGMDTEKLAQAIVIYLLSAVIVVLYWYRMRRLIVATRVLYPLQLALSLSGLILVVMLPKLAQLVVIYGGGSGDLLNWTPAQVVNMLFLSFLGLYDGTCLFYGFSLLRHSHIQPDERRRLRLQMRVQLMGVFVLMVLGVLELSSMKFNNEYVLIVPIVLLLEEWRIARVLNQEISLVQAEDESAM